MFRYRKCYLINCYSLKLYLILCKNGKSLSDAFYSWKLYSRICRSLKALDLSPAGLPRFFGTKNDPHFLLMPKSSGFVSGGIRRFLFPNTDPNQKMMPESSGFVSGTPPAFLFCKKWPNGQLLPKSSFAEDGRRTNSKLQKYVFSFNPFSWTSQISFLFRWRLLQ